MNFLCVSFHLSILVVLLNIKKTLLRFEGFFKVNIVGGNIFFYGSFQIKERCAN